jgi:amino-acid N-acetyltransferase
MQATLRPARAVDIESVRRLLDACKLAPNAFDRQFDEGFVIGVDEQERIVGVAGVEVYGDAGLLRSAAVLPAHQGTGIGKRLTEDRIDWARARGLRTVYLLTETAADYWPRFGFSRIGRDEAPAAVAASVEWSGGCPASAVAMALDLTRRPQRG